MRKISIWKYFAFPLFLVMLLPLNVKATANTRSVWVGEEFSLETNPNIGASPWNVKWTYPNELLYAIGGSSVTNRFKVTQYFVGTAYVKCEWEDVYNAGFPGLESSVRRSNSWNVTCKSNPVRIHEENLKLTVGESVQLHYSHQYQNEYTSYAKPYFYAGETDVVSVSESGEVTAVGEGTAHVYLHSNISGVTPCCVVNVEGKFEGSYVGEYDYNDIKYHINTDEKTAKVIKPKDKNITDNLEIPGIVKYRGIECSVISIEENAFMNCTELTSIIIPNSVTNIGKYAFYGCERLNKIELKNVKHLGKGAFSYCESLVDLNFSNSIESIGEQAFVGCISLEYLKLYKNLDSIGKQAFNGCTNLTFIEISSGIIGEHAFNQCKSLSSVILGDGVKRIKKNAFFWCSSLKHIELGNNIDSIGDDAFWFCENLTNIKLPENVTYIGKNAFFRCGITSIQIPNNVTKIDMGAFEGCSNLSSVILGNGLKQIEDFAFDNCANIEKIKIGESVEEIGSSVFRDCPNIKEIETLAKNPPAIKITTFDPETNKNAIVKVPEGCLKAYKSAPYWKYFYDNIQEEVSLKTSDINLDSDSKDIPVYNLQGVEMKVNKGNLPMGVYIQGGKKFIVR